MTKKGKRRLHSSVKKRIKIAESIMEGTYHFPSGEELLGDVASSFDMLLFDPNNPWTSKKDQTYVLKWIKKKCKADLKQIPIRATFVSLDTKVVVHLYDKGLGVNGEWLLSRWVQEGAKDWYCLATEDMYAMTLEEYNSL